MEFWQKSTPPNSSPPKKAGSDPKIVITSLNSMHPCFGPGADSSSTAVSGLGDGFLGGESALLIEQKLISASEAMLLLLLCCCFAELTPPSALESFLALSAM